MYSCRILQNGTLKSNVQRLVGLFKSAGCFYQYVRILGQYKHKNSVFRRKFVSGIGHALKQNPSEPGAEEKQQQNAAFSLTGTIGSGILICLGQCLPITKFTHSCVCNWMELDI